MANSRVAELIALVMANVTPPPADASPDPVPPNASFPYITVGEVNSREAESLTGKSGLCHVLMQISCWDKDYEVAWALRERVKSYLMSFRGVAGTQTVQGVNDNHSRELYDGPRSLHQHVTRLWMWWES